MATVGHYNSMDVRPWNKPALETSQKLSLHHEYVAPPRCIPGFAQLDIDRKTNIRVKTYVTDVTKKDLVVHSDSWLDTINYSVKTNWLELAPAALDFQSGKFSTQEDHPWNKPQEKTSRHIKFTCPFVTPPKVLAFISEIDINKDANFRAKVFVTDINTEGFVIHLDTWGGTTLYSMEAQWVAYPEDRANIFSTVFNTMDVRPWEKPQLETSNQIDFGGHHFQHDPKVFIAISSIDLNNDANLRIHTYVKDVTKSGLVWHMDGWSNTKVYSAGGVIIALE